MALTCDPAEIAHIEQEISNSQNNIGIGVVDMSTNQVRFFTYDETDAFSVANPYLQVMAGHEAAAAMAGIPQNQARGFVLGRQGADWHVFNQSHLNQPDGQRNSLQMDPLLFADVVRAISVAGVQKPIPH